MKIKTSELIGPALVKGLSSENVRLVAEYLSVDVNTVSKHGERSMNTNQASIAQHLLAGRRAFRLANYSWRWAERFDGRPPLTNRVTSAMFRAGWLEEVNGEMRLTSTGEAVYSLHKNG